LKTAQGPGGLDQSEGLRVVARYGVDVDVDAVDPLDLGDRVRHRRLHPDPEHVELEQAEVFDVVLVELAHREPEPARLHRGAVEQRRVREQDPARVDGDVTGQPVEPLDQPEEQVEPATAGAVSYTHLRAHETRHDLVCRLLLEKKKKKTKIK